MDNVKRFVCQKTGAGVTAGAHEPPALASSFIVDDPYAFETLLIRSVRFQSRHKKADPMATLYQAAGKLKRHDSRAAREVFEHPIREEENVYLIYSLTQGVRLIVERMPRTR
jgi:hypothetical protein